MTIPLNRRTFCLSAGATTVGSLSLAASPVFTGRSANEKIVLAVMGLNRGRALANRIVKFPNVSIKYVCDVDSKRADSCANSLQSSSQSPKPLADFRHALDDKDVDALVCAAPNHWHAPATILACAAGKHVYVEKPCCHNPHEGELMVQAARKHNRAVQMGAQRRSGPGTQKAMQELREGAIGKIDLARSWYGNGRGSIGKGKPADVPSNLNYELWQGPAPHVAYFDNRIHYNWHWFWHWGNGELGNNGVHTLDLCRWGLGVEFPTRVTSSGGRYRYIDDQQTPDTHAVCYEFAGGKQMTWEGTSCHRRQLGFVHFYGSKGMMELDSSGTYRILDEKNKLIREEKSPSRGDDAHLTNFFAAIRNDKPLELNAEIAKGYKSTLLCHLGNIAHRTGRTLNCSTKDGHILGDNKAMSHWKRDYEKNWEPVL